MKLILRLITLFVTLPALLCAAPTNKRKLLQGSIKVEGKDQKVPGFRILFNGMETKNNREGFFAFSVAETLERYNIVVCQEINQNYEDANTIDSIALPTGKRARVVTLSSATSEDGTLELVSDTYHEKSNGSLSKRMGTHATISTENSVIILVDPKYVARIEPWKVTLQEGFTKLPRLVLKGDAPEKIEKASTKSILSSLDLKPFHEPCYGKKRKLAQGKIKIAVLP